MGAWGHGPFDNNSALDWASELRTSDALIKDIKGALKLKKEGYDEIRASAHIIPVAYRANILRPDRIEYLVSDVIDALNNMLNDSEWISSWKYPASIKRSIRSQIRKLKSIQEEL